MVDDAAMALTVSGAMLLAVGSEEGGELPWLDVMDCAVTVLNAVRRSSAHRWYFSFLVNWSLSPYNTSTSAPGLTISSRSLLAYELLRKNVRIQRTPTG